MIVMRLASLLVSACREVFTDLSHCKCGKHRTDETQEVRRESQLSVNRSENPIAQSCCVRLE